MENLRSLLAQYETIQSTIFGELHSRIELINKAALVSETDQYGTITFVNEKFCTTAKYKEEELLGKPHNMVRHPDTPKEVFAEMWKTIKEGKVFNGIIKNKAKDGSPYWVDATVAPVLNNEGKPFKYIAVRFDITEEILAQEKSEKLLEQTKLQNADLVSYKEELEQNLEEIKAMQLQMADSLRQSEKMRAELNARMNVIDHAALVSESDLYGTITYANDKFCEVSGYTREELIGQPHNTIRHPDMPKAAFKEMWETIKIGGVFKGTIKNQKKDGSPYWVEVTISPVLGNDGKPERYIGIRFDITDRVLAERNNKRLLAEVEEQYDELKRNAGELKLKKKMQESISYARRIQQALLPSSDIIQNHLENSFVLYKPKDIVSGDFYWFHQDDSRIVIAAIDCTGHGVPGALMSVIANSLMNETIIEKGIYDPQEILNTLQNRIIDLLRQEEENGQRHDGWDMGICVIDKAERAVHFASAKHPLYYVENGSLQEIKGNKMSIGGAIYKGKSFDSHHISLNGHPIRFYLFSDGIPDQFGGPNNRKYMNKKIKDLIEGIQNVPIAAQKDIIETEIEDWMCGYDQTDDMVMIGFELR